MNKSKPVVPIKIEVTDLITPKSCANFIAELIKFIAYNKQQIPYPYERLKMFVVKRRERQKMNELSSTEAESDTARVAFLMEKHYKKVEEAFSILDSTFKCIEHELMQSAEYPVEEIVLLFGATPLSPRDVYRIRIPPLCFGHSESQHLWRKQLNNLFREIIISDNINANLQKKVGLTNMFVMMKVKKGGCASSKWLLPKDQYRLSDRVDQVCFSFKSSTSKPCKCPDMIELKKLARTMTALSINDDDIVPCDNSDSAWFQTSRTLMGFRDSKSKGKSITDLWYKHGFIS